MSPKSRVTRSTSKQPALKKKPSKRSKDVKLDATKRFMELYKAETKTRKENLLDSTKGFAF